MYDMAKCPQTEQEFCEYFYALIGKSLGQPANDFEQVLSRAYPWNGQSLMIPPGVGPGIRQQPGAPFYGLTQQFSGQPKARVFLPSNTPDDLGYYTRCMQYVDDAVGTFKRTKRQPTAQDANLVWAWYLAGPDNAYAPLQPAEGGGTVPPTTTGISKEECQEMINASLATFTGIAFGNKVALRMNSGKLLSIVGGGPTEDDKPVELISRPDIHAWESLTIEKGE
jgi:hypothetical protein